MSKHFRTIVAAGLIWALAGHSAGAQTAETSAIQEETARLQALAARYQAQAALEQARLAPLTGLAGEGKVSLGDGAGSLESWILASSAVSAAARDIVLSLPAEIKVVVLAGDESFNLRLLQSLRLEVAGLQSQLDDANDAVIGKCTPPRRSDRGAPIVPILGAVAGLLRSDVDLRGVKVEASDRLLSTAVVKALGPRAIIPSALQSPPLSSTLTDDVALMDRTAREAIEARACLGRIEKPNELQKANMSSLDAVLTRFRTFKTTVTTSDANGRSPFSDALVLLAIEAQNPIVLRVHLDKAGGTLETHKNLLTAFGMPPVRVTGGLVASFIATAPSTGIPVAAGVVACRTGKLPLTEVHAQVVPASCSVVTK